MNHSPNFSSSPRFALIVGIVAACVAANALAATPALTIDDESPLDVATFTYTGAPGIKVSAGSGYILCANTPWQTGSQTASALQLIPTNPNGFVFGATNSSGGNVSLNDVRSFAYRYSSAPQVDVNTTGGASTLGCFITDASGARTKWYNGLFDDTFDNDAQQPATPGPCSAQSVDSCVAVHVDSLVANNGAVDYTYYLDYHLPAGIYNYVLRDGYNDLFSTTTTWCVTASITDTTCIPGLSKSTRTVDQSLTGQASGPIDGRIKVVRTSLPGLGIPDLQAATGPLVLAALFPEASPTANERATEYFLSDNVSSGTAAIYTPVANNTTH